MHGGPRRDKRVLCLGTLEVGASPHGGCRGPTGLRPEQTTVCAEEQLAGAKRAASERLRCYSRRACNALLIVPPHVPVAALEAPRFDPERRRKREGSILF